jgi:hypothetical protein
MSIWVRPTERPEPRRVVGPVSTWHDPLADVPVLARPVERVWVVGMVHRVLALHDMHKWEKRLWLNAMDTLVKVA